MNDNYKKLAQEWFDGANEDEAVAQLLYNEKGYPRAICFHAHQAAEKYLKGFLVFNGKDIEEEFKIHNLNKLFDYCKEINKNFDNKNLEESCNFLNKYYIATRYPGDIEDYTWSEVKEALNAVVIIKEHTKQTYWTESLPDLKPAGRIENLLLKLPKNKFIAKIRIFCESHPLKIGIIAYLVLLFATVFSVLMGNNTWLFFFVPILAFVIIIIIFNTKSILNKIKSLFNGIGIFLGGLLYFAFFVGIIILLLFVFRALIHFLIY